MDIRELLNLAAARSSGTSCPTNANATSNPRPVRRFPTQANTVGRTHFDGRGHLTWVEHTVIDGTLLEPAWTAATGTYTVNPDCTGTGVANTLNIPCSSKPGFRSSEAGQRSLHRANFATAGISFP
jgi:hypothetical protein